MEYVFRIEKRDQEHPLVPQVLVEFGCNADNPRAMIESVVAFGELLKIYGTPDKVVEFMKHNAGVQRAKLFVEEVLSKG
jgi:hypothetical protein